MMGGIVGAAIVYANYFHAIDLVEGGNSVRTLKTAGLFSTYAVSLFLHSVQDYRADLSLSLSLKLDYMTNVSAFFSEFLGTAILLIAILAFTDRKNPPLPNGLLPVALFLLFVGLGSSLGMETGTTCSLSPLFPIQPDCHPNRLCSQSSP